MAPNLVSRQPTFAWARAWVFVEDGSRAPGMTPIGRPPHANRCPGGRFSKVHPHRFRHTFATWAIESGAREIDVQMLLGHSDLTMTHRYARTYTSEPAVRAHSTLRPVSHLS